MDDSITRYIVRDADALLSLRDQSAVEEWISLGSPYFFPSTTRPSSAWDCYSCWDVGKRRWAFECSLTEFFWFISC